MHQPNIHPIPNQTAPAANNPNAAYTTGCKGVACEDKAEISLDGKDIYGDETYTYEDKSEGAVVSPGDEQKSKNSWDSSRRAMKQIRDLFNTNKDKLQAEDNFELKVEPNTNQ
jgi:hypothetical protein